MKIRKISVNFLNDVYVEFDAYFVISPFVYLSCSVSRILDYELPPGPSSA